MITFRPLVEINRALDSRDDAQLLEAIVLAKETTNVPLMRRLAAFVNVDTEQWQLDAQDRYNEVARQKREEYHVASASLDSARIAEASIQEGLWHINGGEYRLAQASFKSAANLDESRSLLCSWLCAQLDLLRGDWMLVTSQIERTFAAASARIDEPYAAELLHSHALALWKQQMWADVATALLHTADHPCSPERWAWTDPQETAIMCVCSALASFDRETLEFMVHGDLPMQAIFRSYPYLRELVVGFIEVDIARFWKEWASLVEAASRSRGWWLLRAQLQQLEQQLKRLLVNGFLSVRNQCTLEVLMEAMNVSNVLELAAEIRAQKYPVELDASGVCRITKPGTRLEPAEVFAGDAMAVIWHSISASLQSRSGRPVREKHWRRENHDGPGRPKWRVKR